MVNENGGKVNVVAKKNKVREGSRPIEIELKTYAQDDETRNELAEVLKMFYKGAVMSSIGLAEALNENTNQKEIVLVGVTKNPWGTDTLYPLALSLNAEDMSRYSFPDGNGNYVKHAVAGMD